MGFPEIHPFAQSSYETDQWENLQPSERGGRKEMMEAKRGTTEVRLNLRVPWLRITSHDLNHIPSNRSRV